MRIYRTKTKLHSKLTDVSTPHETADVADGAITTPKIADGAVTNIKILDSTIHASKIDSEYLDFYSPNYREQTVNGHSLPLYSGYYTRGGQKLNLPSCRVDKLTFKLKKTGSPTGDITFTIRKQSDDSILLSGVLGDASTLTTDFADYTVTFSSPADISGNIYVLVEYAGGDSSNTVDAGYTATYEKSGENMVEYASGYFNKTSWDWYYRIHCMGKRLLSEYY